MHQSKMLAKLLTAAGAAILALALLAPMAQAAETEPNYEQFNGCPTVGESEGSIICIRADVTGGYLNVGNKEVPINEPLVINGGVNGALQEFMAGPEGGLSEVPQKVPGGVLGLTGLTWLLEFFGSEALTLYATSELAGPPTNFTVSSVRIPIKVHLTNPAGLLGGNCYLGEDEPGEAVVLQLNTSTEGGQFPEISVDSELQITHLDNGIYVDNTFEAPGVNGCVLTLFGFIPIPIDGLVNELSGLPAASGNEAVQEFSIEFTPRVNVYGP
jgi:hypothetical protein